MSLILYHNPRCSKSRQTLALLEERGKSPEIVEYLKSPPDIATLKVLSEKLGLAPQEMLRTGEKEYRELKLDDPDLDEEAVLSAIADHPKLLERPILEAGDRARIGRPPEAVLEIL